MDPILAVAAAIAALVIGAVVWRLRSRRESPQIRRDTPTIDRPPAIRGFGGRLGGLFGRGIDDAFWAGVEETLIQADVGVASSMGIVERVRSQGVSTPEEARAALRSELIAAFADRDRSLNLEGSPAVIVVVGVNGSGKTTSIAKLASLLQGEGKSVLLGAADTFRAAAAAQLQQWGSRLGVEVVAGQEGADPASVAFDARSAAAARGIDVVIIDTAGRLHSKRNLMDELGKIVRVLGRDGPVSEVLLVLDGTSGQNGIVQTKAFVGSVGVTGVILTKLDGTARGGIAVAVERELGVPVKLLGVGEGPGDLLHFQGERFVDALMEEE
ncbi:MAG: signal recognition particle-docking protein FtsY [Acidimicrobiia bacterium]